MKDTEGGRHKWNYEDKCIKCGLERRWTRLSVDGILFGRPTHEFLIDGEWKIVRTTCPQKSAT